MAQVKITLRNQSVDVYVKQIADKYNCIQKNSGQADIMLFEKENPEGFISELKLMHDIILHIDIEVI